MQITFKSVIPALATLLLGMMLFIFLGTISAAITLPPMLRPYLFSGLVILFVYGVSKFFLQHERIPLTAVNLIPDNRTWLRLVMGLVVGGVISGLMLAALFSLTDLAVEREQTQTLLPFIMASLVFIPLALMEELLFRGYPFFRLSQVMNIRWVLLITAILFALYHYNESTSLGTVLLGPGIWGVTYGVAAYMSNSIALPLGIHAAANVMQALFGLKPAYLPMWQVNVPDSSWTSSTNPDSLGIVMQLVLLVFSVAVLEWHIARRKN